MSALQKSAEEFTPSVDFDMESELSDITSLDDDLVEIVVGPTAQATSAVSMDALSLSHEDEHGRHYFPILSSPGCLYLGDVRRLSQARLRSAPLSFGSIVHLNFGATQNCRPCMFEKQRSGRCRRSWLCDFCHMHPKEAFVSHIEAETDPWSSGGRPPKQPATSGWSKVPQRPTGSAPQLVAQLNEKPSAKGKTLLEQSTADRVAALQRAVAQHQNPAGWTHGSGVLVSVFDVLPDSQGAQESEFKGVLSH
eukprot:CAMPEP_0170580630 /NCGR_PEP_ID=MMETSP0224-20130122/6610_1 /TAXON_ID=285029 /ORGANISM="Togula jolla, Strain CCCM 725" /LENGTH=250 /DNA_ID=CAMNT_0010903715 /DNA_START=170 /DNA_END=920 /DNA_ORIENTATION=-